MREGLSGHSREHRRIGTLMGRVVARTLLGPPIRIEFIPAFGALVVPVRVFATRYGDGRRRRDKHALAVIGRAALYNCRWWEDERLVK